MKYVELKRINEAPVKGYCLVYTRSNVIFEAYDNILDVSKSLGDQELLEVHLFDDIKEYRAISSVSSRYENGIIEHLACFDENNEVFIDKTLLLDGRRLDVINKLAFDENSGMLSISDYRLKMGGKE